MRHGQVFEDRRDAGKRLAARLKCYSHRPEVLVLALPRGGVPVAYEIAKALEVELDVLVVRKLGVPGQSELAMGAVASGGCCYLNQGLIQQIGIPEWQVQTAVAAQTQELERKERAFRADRPPLQLKNRIVLLVDDGLATGATMQAALRAISTQSPRETVIAVPVASASAREKLAPQVAQWVCLQTPESFRAVSEWYLDFRQTTDDDVRALLSRASIF